MPGAAILDIDGTLVDTNYHHALAWWRALRQSDLTVPLWRIHRSIGMGGEKLVPSLIGERLEAEHGADVRTAESILYRELMPEVVPFTGARPLIEALAATPVDVVLASSAKAFEVEHYLDLLNAREIAAGWTSSADVEATKPEPDLVHAALDRVGAQSGVMLGDSVFDCQAAARAGLQSVGVLTGGFSAEELQDAGAVKVYDSLEAVIEHLDETPFADLIAA